MSDSRSPIANCSYVAWLLAAVLTSSCYLGVCRGRLDDVGYRCPKSFDGTAAAMPPCESFDHPEAPICGTLPGLPQCRPFDHSEIRMCGGLIELSSGPGLGGGGCYYDSDTHQLAGAYHFADTPRYCDRSSHDQTAGRSPSSGACRRAPALVLECSASEMRWKTTK